MQEKSYPIYKFTAFWNQDDYKNNSTDCNIMYNEPPTETKLNEDIHKWKSAIEKSQIDKGKPIIEWISLNYYFVENETWCLQWFYHMTYNQFENDYQAELSFERYVDRIKNQNRLNKKELDSGLMGADERWRWEVCHCNKCKENGWTAINH